MKNFLIIDKTDYINSINLYLGLYFPLKGFSTKNDYERILENKKLNNNNFTVPINLFCTKLKADSFTLGDTIYLKYKGDIIGFLKLKSKFKIEKIKLIKKLFGTTSKAHLGVNNYLKKIKGKSFCLGGEVNIFKSKIKKYFKYSNFITIKNLKKIQNRAVAFSTRNIPHIGHNLIQKKIIESKKNLTIFLILGLKNKYNQTILKKTYTALKKNKIFNKINVLFIHLPTFFAGPNEAFFQAKIFENMKFKYFYVGRDHAGYKSFYKKYESQNIFDNIKTKIKIIKLNEPMFCNSCDKAFILKSKKIKLCSICRSRKLSELNGKEVKLLIRRKNKNLLYKLLDPFVYNFLKKRNFSLQDI